MASSAANAVAPLTSNIRVSAANNGGWIITVERNRQALVTEHHTDWHRVERRVETLKSTIASLLARVAAAIVIALATVAPAIAQDAPTGLLPEPSLITKAVERVSSFKGDKASAPKDGFYAHTGQMITGAGWISLGPGYRRHLLGGHAVADVSTALSWRGYKTAQARVELPSLADGHVVIGSQVRWSDLTQVTYFGAGADAVEAQRSDYRLQTTDTVFYATVRRNQIVSLTGGIGWLARPAISSSTGPFDRDLPDTADLFSSEPGARRARQPRFLHRDLALAADTRDEPGHPSRGGLYRAALSGFRDLEDDAFTFDRYELEGAHFVPFWAGRMVLAVHGWGVFSSTAAGREVPFYLLPSLGGHNSLRGYTDYRFHDRNLLAVNVESRWALFRHVDAAVFADAGNVAPRASDLDLSRTSYGTGVRLHSGASTIARLDVGKSGEGWHFMFRLNDPLRLSRIARRTAAIPFVP
jgi:hypothetical protein